MSIKRVAQIHWKMEEELAVAQRVIERAERDGKDPNGFTLRDLALAQADALPEDRRRVISQWKYAGRIRALVSELIGPKVVPMNDFQRGQQCELFGVRVNDMSRDELIGFVGYLDALATYRESQRRAAPSI